MRHPGTCNARRHDPSLQVVVAVKPGLVERWISVVELVGPGCLSTILAIGNTDPEQANFWVLFGYEYLSEVVPRRGHDDGEETRSA